MKNSVSIKRYKKKKILRFFMNFIIKYLKKYLLLYNIYVKYIKNMYLYIKLV